MILKIDSRTDIPAFYSDWIVNRFKEGFLYFRDPDNYEKIYKVILDKNHIEGIIWNSKNFAPIIPKLDEITKDFPSIFHYTINNYGNTIENNLSYRENVRAFINLSDKYGKDKVIWRYDPIFITKNYNLLSHSKNFANICNDLYKYTDKVIVNFISINEINSARLPEMIELSQNNKKQILGLLGRCASQYGLKFQFCGNGLQFKDLEDVEIIGCLDKGALELLSIETDKKQKSNELGCWCYPTISVGEFNTCLNKCQYCNICKNFEKCEENYRKHDPKSPLLVGWPIGNEEIIELKPKLISSN